MSKNRHRRESAPPGQPVTVELVPTPSDRAITVRFLGAILGMLTHWTGKDGSKACPGWERCPTADHRKKTVWKGYAPVEYFRPPPFQDWCPAVFEVTERMEEILRGRELRGESWSFIRRPGRHGNQEVASQFLESMNPAALRPEFPVEPVLFRVYRVLEIALGVANPLPPRLILEPTPAGAVPVQAGRLAPRQPPTSGKILSGEELLQGVNRLRGNVEISPSPNGKH